MCGRIKVSCPDVTAGGGVIPKQTEAHAQERPPTDFIDGTSDGLLKPRPLPTQPHTLIIILYHNHSQERRVLLLIKRHPAFIAGTHTAAVNTDEFTQINSCQTAAQTHPPVPERLSAAEDVEAG